MIESTPPTEHVELLANIRHEHDRLVELQDRCRAEFDSFVMYRYFHRSWKVFEAKRLIDQMLGLFLNVAPDGVAVDGIFSRSIKDALSREWSETTNDNWEAEVGPVVHTYWQMRYFIDECIRCGTLSEVPETLPEGWAALLEIFAIRDSVATSRTHDAPKETT